uniref:MULE domain-containing protein n=1 Tax=Panagrellus redivivus TaxID=6233 RepID=A0A7E4V886_PANRE
MFRSQKQIGVDATYKLTHNGYPVIIVGFSDQHHKYYPTAVALVSVENTDLYEKVLRSCCGDGSFVEVIADGALCIAKACKTFTLELSMPMAVNERCARQGTDRGTTSKVPPTTQP